MSLFPIRSHRRPLRSYDPIDVIYRSLEVALGAECARRYDASISLRRTVRPTADAESVSFRVRCRGLLDLPGRLVVAPGDDGTYVVQCSVGDTVSDRFSFSQPEGSGVKLSHAPSLGRILAQFLLDEVTKTVGTRLLNGPAGPPTLPASVHLS